MTQIRYSQKPSADLLAKQLGLRICMRLGKAIEKKGSATLVVSGGSTPKPLFEYLSQQPIEWNKVRVTLADERCVPSDDDASNAKLVREYLLKNYAADAEFIPLYDASLEDAEQLSELQAKLDSLPIYDAVVLGMGDDGHTASIFPRAANRDQALDLNTSLTALMTDPVTVGPMRITQTRQRLLKTAFLAIYFTGNDKLSLFNEIAESSESSTLPIGYFLRQNKVPVDVFCTTLSQSDAHSIGIAQGK